MAIRGKPVISDLLIEVNEDFVKKYEDVKNKMEKFKSLDSYTINKIGKVFIVENNKNRDRDKNDLIGSKVVIDDEVYKIKGVESFALLKIRKKQKIGLLVEQ